jgi:hypothetical protein
MDQRTRTALQESNALLHSGRHCERFTLEGVSAGRTAAAATKGSKTVRMFRALIVNVEWIRIVQVEVEDEKAVMGELW